MSGNTFGTLFRITTFGESHGPALGVIIDGCPAGLELDQSLIEQELQRRKPGQSKLVTPRQEPEGFCVLSGVFEGRTTGCPIAVVIENTDVKSKDYAAIKDLFRPGHADFPYFAKYGHRDYRGGGRSSARETAARVIGGAVAKQILANRGISIVGGVVQIASVVAEKRDWAEVEKNSVRSVDFDVVEAMEQAIDKARHDRDSVGGIVEVQAQGVPPGWGDPVFDKLDAAVAASVMSIPAVKGVEIGEGFRAATLRGSQMNDEMHPEGFASNNHGGILGGLSSGAPVVVRAVLKPTSSIPQEKNTVDTEFNSCKVKTLGRHDPCVAIRAVPIVEAMLALVLVDFMLRDEAHRAGQSSEAKSSRIEYGLRKDA